MTDLNMKLINIQTMIDQGEIAMSSAPADTMKIIVTEAWLHETLAMLRAYRSLAIQHDHLTKEGERREEVYRHYRDRSLLREAQLGRLITALHDAAKVTDNEWDIFMAVRRAFKMDDGESALTLQRELEAAILYMNWTPRPE